MNVLVRRVAPIAAAAAVVAAVSAQPAQAQNQQCDQGARKLIKIPRAPDVSISHQTCVIAWPQGGSDYRLKAWVHTTFESIGNGRLGKRFEDFTVYARLEANKRGRDTNLKESKCDIAWLLNEARAQSNTCDTAIGTYGETRPTFTGDGTVIYDVDGDGKGNRKVELRGTQRVP
jgi:hypothetical protein